jgi:hypothetical protein
MTGFNPSGNCCNGFVKTSVVAAAGVSFLGGRYIPRSQECCLLELDRARALGNQTDTTGSAKLGRRQCLD